MISVSEPNVSEQHSSNRKLEDFWHLQKFFPKGVGVLKQKTKVPSVAGGGGGGGLLNKWIFSGNTH